MYDVEGLGVCVYIICCFCVVSYIFVWVCRWSCVKKKLYEVFYRVLLKWYGSVVFFCGLWCLEVVSGGNVPVFPLLRRSWCF